LENNADFAVTNSVFDGNQAVGLDGGALINGQNSYGTLTHTTFIRNTVSLLFLLLLSGPPASRCISFP